MRHQCKPTRAFGRACCGSHRHSYSGLALDSSSFSANLSRVIRALIQHIDPSSTRLGASVDQTEALGTVGLFEIDAENRIINSVEALAGREDM